MQGLEKKHETGDSSFKGKNLEKEREGNEKHPAAANLCAFNHGIGGRPLPPPLAILKLCKTGKRFSYVTFSEKTNSFVHEEIRIPTQGFLLASRSNGCLVLFPAHPDEENLEKDDNSFVLGETRRPATPILRPYRSNRRLQVFRAITDEEILEDEKEEANESMRGSVVERNL